MRVSLATFLNMIGAVTTINLKIKDVTVETFTTADGISASERCLTYALLNDLDIRQVVWFDVPNAHGGQIVIVIT